MREQALSPYQRWPVMEQGLYNQLRDPGAPQARTLLLHHQTESWVLVCKKAAALPIGGEALVTGTSWHHDHRGTVGPRSRPKYARADVVRAIQACAAAHSRPVGDVTSTFYIEWSAAQRSKARARSRTRVARLAADPRLPSWGIVLKLFGKWSRAARGWRLTN